MSNKKREILFLDGSRGDSGDFPIAVVKEFNSVNINDLTGEGQPLIVVDPILETSVYNNLYGRIITLLEATTDSSRLKAVKDVFSNALHTWFTDVQDSAREIAQGGDSDRNIYTRGR